MRQTDHQQIQKLIDAKIETIQQERKQAERLERAFGELEAACPGAGDLNENAKVNGFGKYLDGYFGETGITRRQMATMAIDAIKAGASESGAHHKTLVSIFKGFSSEDVGQDSTTPQGAGSKTNKPDPRLYIQPRLAGGDSLPKRGETITQAEAERMLDEASRKGQAEFDKAQRIISKKAAAGEIR